MSSITSLYRASALSTPSRFVRGFASAIPPPTKRSVTSLAEDLRVEAEENVTLQPVDLSSLSAPPIYTGTEIPKREYKIYTKSHIGGLMDKYNVPIDHRPFLAAASVLPMRTNNYVVEELIDWSNIPNDPMFQLVFPQPGMLSPDDLQHVMNLHEQGASRVQLRDEVDAIRLKLNPHPAGQKKLNVPRVNGEAVEGMQHKYRETVLFFPMEAQYCHSYCTYCFRWAQFTAVGSSQQFASKNAYQLKEYLRQNKGVSDLLLTGGDPMVMKAHQFAQYLEPLLFDKELDHISTVRIGTKSVAYWPQRFVTADDSDDILRLLSRVVAAGKHVSIMAHFSHPAELSTPVAQEAIRRIRSTGAQVRCQAPLINHVNADPDIWTTMWRTQLRLGAIPYYMFVERDTGARHYFEVPLVKAHEIYTKAVTELSGLGRTVRGPSMSATPGKVHVLGTAEIGGEKVIMLKFLQGRNPDWAAQPFFAKYDDKACWLDQLKPAFGEEKFFFEDELAEIEQADTSSGTLFPTRVPYVNNVLPHDSQGRFHDSWRADLVDAVAPPVEAPLQRTPISFSS